MKSNFRKSGLGLGEFPVKCFKKGGTFGNVQNGGLMARKILNKMNGLATRLYITLAIIMPRPWNLLRNTTIYFRLYFIMFGNIFAQGHGFETVTSQALNISYHIV